MLESDEFIATHRANPTDFTRRRTLTLPMLVTCLAQGFIKGLQSELDDFFGRLGNQAAFVRDVTKSAFSQARKKLRPSAFKALNTLLLDRWYQSVEVPRWHGLRLLAADTTTLRVPGLPETIEEFGLHNGGSGEPVPMAMAFGLYEVASGLMLHADLHEGGARDRDLMAGSLSHVHADDLLLLDRGFPSYWLIAWLLQQQRHFCMRVDAMAFKAFDAFLYRSTKAEEVVTVTVPVAAARKAAAKGYVLEQTTFQVRLIRVPLPNGKCEILATSLLDSTAYPVCEFAALYHQRWRIEECFKLLKCRLAVEHFSGELPDSVRQDFLAKVWLANLTATFAYLARASLPTGKQVHFLPNLTYAVAALRASLPRLMLKVRDRIRVVKDILRLVANTLEWVRPDRHFPRERQAVKPIRYRAYKAIR
jgi:hypothetical protein